MVFLNLRQRTDSVQALVIVTPEKISKQMVKWTASLADESIVLVEGVVQKTPEPIKSASVSDVEVHVSQVRAACSLTRSAGSTMTRPDRFISFLELKLDFPSPLTMRTARIPKSTLKVLSSIGFF